MSTLATSAAALLAVVQLLDDMDSENTSVADFRAWDAKGTDWGAVVMQRAPSVYGRDLVKAAAAHGTRQQQHRLAVLLARKRGQAPDGDGAIVAALWAKTDALIALIDTYPRLNSASGVIRAEVVEAGEPRIRQGSPWIYQIVAVDVWTRTSPVLVETAYA